MSTQISSDTKILLIFTPVKAERAAVDMAVNRWTASVPESLRSTSYENIVIEQIGVRGTNLRDILPRYTHSPVAGIITAGIAGALSPELDVGDLVLDSASSDVQRVADFMNTMSNSRRVCVGPVHTSKTL